MQKRTFLLQVTKPALQRWKHIYSCYKEFVSSELRICEAVIVLRRMDYQWIRARLTIAKLT
jgi:hypothetical protein